MIGRANEWRVAVHATLHDGWRVVHGTLTLVLAWLALVLAVPPNTFATGVSYDLMERLAPEGLWAAIFGLGAVAGAAGLVMRRPAALALSCAVLCMLHGTFALLILLANPASTGSGTYGLLALLALGRLIRGDGRWGG